MNKLKITSGLIENLKETYGERLISIILYGSCAGDVCENEFSDINIMVIVDSLLALDLKNATSAISEFMKTKNPLPLFMDKEEWFNSCDVYPIEYSDIKDRYKILYGEDIVKPLVLEKSNLRLQCEHEIKNLLIKLRQNYLAQSNDLRAIEKLLKTSSKSFFALFRAILRLTDEKVSFDHVTTINSLSQKVKIDKDVFLKLLDFRTNSKAIVKSEFEITIQKLIDSTDEVLKYIDKM
jgi:predicted nucleotidyltransferase